MICCIENEDGSGCWKKIGGGCVGSNDIGIDILLASVIGKETVFGWFGFINIVDGAWKNWTGCWILVGSGFVGCTDGATIGGGGCAIVIGLSRGSSSSLSEP